VLGLYLLFSIMVFIAAVASPAVRGMAYAPLRDWILPQPAPVVVHLLYSTEKDAWLQEAVKNFTAAQPHVNGHPVQLELTSMGSREMVLAVLDGKEKPDLISPAGLMQISLLQDQSTGKFGHPLVNAKDPSACQSVLKSPLVLVAWRDRAQVLWGQTLPADLWKKLHDVLVNPQGWGAFGHPDWGYVKFGHTNPLTSNSGLMTLLAMTYDYFGKSDGLSSNDLLSNPDYQKWLLDSESTISQFGNSTGTYMSDIVAYGPSVYDIVTVYEATAISQAQNAVGRYGALSVYYPPLTIQSDHPFCVLNADWVSPDQAQASKMFVDYLLSQPAQQLALLKYGFRPVNPSVPLDSPGSPFTQYGSLGISLTLPPEAGLPSPDVLNTLLDFWTRNVAH